MADSPASLADLLKDKSHDELVLIIEELLEREPKLRSTLDILVKLSPAADAKPTAKKKAAIPAATVDVAKIRRQVASVFGNGGGRWASASGVADQLEKIVELADKFEAGGQWEDARIIYSTVGLEAANRYEEIEDEDEVFGVINDCVNGLVEYLDENYSSLEPGGPVLIELFKTFYDLWKFSYNYGDLEEDLAEVITAYVTTEAERTQVESWVRRDIEPGQEFSKQWNNERLVGFLATLKESANFSPTELLEEYRQAGLYKLLAGKLLELDRVDEALKVVAENLSDPSQVTEVAAKILALPGGYPAQAIGVVEEKLLALEKQPKGKKADYNHLSEVERYRQWLGQQYIAIGQPAKALQLEQRSFQASPGVATYERVKTAAVAAQKWSELRPGLLATLESMGNWQALINIYIKENEVGKAIEALASEEASQKNAPFSYGYSQSPASIQLDLKVAEAAREAYPSEAIRLYQSAAQKQIGARSRDSYQQAVTYLGKARELYLKQGQQAEWQTYLTQLRTNNKALRALKEELDKKGW